MWDYVGYLAGFVTAICYVPQLRKTWRTREVKDISFAAYATLFCGLSLWVAFGIGTESWPVIIANGVSLCCVGALLAMKRLFR